MKKLLLFILLIACALPALAQAPKNITPPGSSILAHYEGRTACKEIMEALKMGYREICAKRKLSLILYVDSITGKPSSYRVGGLSTRSGTGNWSIEKGTPTDPEAVIYRLHLGEVDLLLLKGDEQVLFILDQQKNFLVGNELYGYTLNRISDKQSWTKWRELTNRGLPF
jgi:hypothetical protein